MALSEIKTDECIIWKQPAQTFQSGSMVYQVESARTDGAYEIDYIAAMQMPLEAEYRARLTTWLIDQRRAGERLPRIDSEVIQRVAARLPLRLSERTERFFLFLSARRFKPGDKFYTTRDQGRPSDLPNIMAWIEAEHHDDALGFLDYLQAARLVAIRATGMFELTAEGFARLEVAELRSPMTAQAFVAMWFGAEMDAAYEDGIKPAVENAGFNPLRIDRKEHSNKIDDEIIMEIRRSRFVVADFTCELTELQPGKKQALARGGVYYEAGFAQGLNIPLIWTVRRECIDFVHFDTRQFAHIVWDDPADLRVKLANRIGATIGTFS